MADCVDRCEYGIGMRSARCSTCPFDKRPSTYAVRESVQKKLREDALNAMVSAGADRDVAEQVLDELMRKHKQRLAGCMDPEVCFYPNGRCVEPSRCQRIKDERMRPAPPKAACEKCESTDTFWTPHNGPHLHCNGCGHIERDAGVPHHLRKDCGAPDG